MLGGLLGPLMSSLFSPKVSTVDMAGYTYGGVPINLNTLSGLSYADAQTAYLNTINNLSAETDAVTTKVTDQAQSSTNDILNILMQQYQQGQQYLQPFISNATTSGQSLLDMWNGTPAVAGTSVDKAMPMPTRPNDADYDIHTMEGQIAKQEAWSKYLADSKAAVAYNNDLMRSNNGSTVVTTPGTPGTPGIFSQLAGSGTGSGTQQQQYNDQTINSQFAQPQMQGYQSFSQPNLPSSGQYGQVNTQYPQFQNSTNQAIQQALQGTQSQITDPNSRWEYNNNTHQWNQGTMSALDQFARPDLSAPNNATTNQAIQQAMQGNQQTANSFGSFGSFARPDSLSFNAPSNPATNQAIQSAQAALQAGADPQSIQAMFQQPQLNTLNFQQQASDTLGALTPALRALGQGMGSDTLPQYAQLASTSPADFTTNTMNSLFNTTSGVAQPYIDMITQQGQRAIQNTAAARGMLDSGRTLNELNEMGMASAAQYMNPLIQSGMGMAGDYANTILNSGTQLQNTMLNNIYGVGGQLTSDVMGNSLQNLLSNQNNSVSMRAQDMGMYADLSKALSSLGLGMRGQDYDFATNANQMYLDQRGQDVDMRGQDIGQYTTMRGQDMTYTNQQNQLMNQLGLGMRGQDYSFAQAMAGLGVDMRGQDIGYTTDQNKIAAQLGLGMREQDLGWANNAMNAGVTQRGQDMSFDQSMAGLGMDARAQNMGYEQGLYQLLSGMRNQNMAYGQSQSQFGQTDATNRLNIGTSALSNMFNTGSQSGAQAGTFANQYGMNYGNQQNLNTSNLANAWLSNQNQQQNLDMMVNNLLLQGSLTPTYDAQAVYNATGGGSMGGGGSSGGGSLSQLGGMGMMLGGEMGGVGGAMLGGLGSLGAILGFI